MTDTAPSRAGAQSLVETFVNAGVDVCFANPGTSEMHFVAALDTHPDMRCILGLFEGVVTGAADGYGRMKGTPAATLLHLGPGVGNGLANLHNAKKARTPVVNVIGDHATYHRQFDAPLTSDVEGIARPVSDWVKVSTSADEVAADGALAVQAALSAPGQVASLILPADTAWNETRARAKTRNETLAPTSPLAIDSTAVDDAAKALCSGAKAIIFLRMTLTEELLEWADRIAAATGATLVSDTFVGRTERGAGRPYAMRLPYFGEQAEEALEGTRHLVVVGGEPPVTFFAYPGKANELTPPRCEVHRLVPPNGDIQGILEALAHAVGATSTAFRPVELELPSAPTGTLTPKAIGAAVARAMPDHTIVINESGTSGGGVEPLTRKARPHDWLGLTGGSIGFGLPAATGAAVACPDRKVLCLQADGSGMYTLQALWTQAREKLDVTTVIFSNRKYAILQHEFARVGAHNPGPKALSMLDLGNPDLNWVSLADGMGVPAERVDTAEGFTSALERALAYKGPALIEAVL